MDKKTQQEHHTKWQVLIDEQEKSGLSQTEFCKQRNIVLSQFSYYRGLIKAKDRTSLRRPELFSPIQVKKSETKSLDEIKIVLPNGFQCYFSASVESVQIKRLVEALLSC